MYSLSTVPNPDWSRSYSPQPEIREYLERVADAEDLRRHVRFGQEMTGATWDEQSRTWTVHTRGGRSWRARFLVHGVGALHLPKTPDLPGAASFDGPSFHSARWDHDVDLRGKKVAVIGTGASAIQFVPQIAGVAAEVQLYQRTPAWVLPKNDKPLPRGPTALLRPPPARPPGVPVGDVRGAGVARPRLQLEPGGPAARRVARHQEHRAPRSTTPSSSRS